MQKKQYVILLIIGMISFNIASFHQQYPIDLNLESNRLKTSIQDISIATPENKTYTEPMSGYYPGTYSFDGEEDNENPEDWLDVSGPSCDAQVIAEKSGHKKVLELSDNNAVDNADIYQTFESAQITGEIEWWWSSDDVTKLSRLNVYASNNDQAIVIQIDSDKFQYYDSPTPTDILDVTPLDHAWYHLKLVFNCSSDTFDLYINGVLRLNDANFRNAVNDCEWLRFQTSNSDISHYQYIDAVGYSWDSDYNTGDNLYEGLLLSYTTNFEPEWQGYSLDGLSNKTISGNITFSLPNDGLHTIQLFGNDSIGSNYKSEIRFFELDLNAPIININSPAPDQYFGIVSPNFDLSIIELNLDCAWYTLDNGVTNITLTGLTGTISQTEWDKLSEGSVIIRFYANDTFGRENFAEITINKDITDPLLTINLPLSRDKFTKISPAYDISVIEDNLDLVWYTIDGGITNISISSLIGHIDSDAWKDAPTGTITIRFYVRDLAGNEVYQEVLVIKKGPGRQ